MERTFTVTCPYDECAEEFDVLIPEEDLAPGGELAGVECAVCTSDCDLLYDAASDTLTAIELAPEDLEEDAEEEDEGEAEEEDEDEEDEENHS